MINATENLQSPAWQGGMLRCVARREETHDSASFDLASDEAGRFDFKPGQFVTIGADIDGKRHYRAYSMSSSPSRHQALTITVRRLPNGLVSNHLLDNFKVGDVLEGGATAGEFFLSPEDARGRLVLLSAGSGVTPVMAMARWLLERNADCSIQFIYSARSENDVIFRDELLAMQKNYPNFRLDLFLDQGGGTLNAQVGFLSSERLDGLIDDPAACRYFMCGNVPYMEMVEKWYRARGLAADRFHKESFRPEDVPAATDSDETYQLSVPAFGKTARIGAAQTLLEIMEKNEVPIIGACRSGVCGSCKCKVTSGEVERLSTATLTPEQVEEGFVLACSTRAKSDISVELAL